LDGLEELDIPNNAVASLIETVAARPRAKREFTEKDRVTAFEDFGVGNTSVGHAARGKRSGRRNDEGQTTK
jgi:hypothetical protein